MPSDFQDAEDERNRVLLREWLAAIEPQERTRMFQFFALQFGTALPGEMIMQRRTNDGITLQPPVEALSQVAQA